MTYGRKDFIFFHSNGWLLESCHTPCYYLLMMCVWTSIAVRRNTEPSIFQKSETQCLRSPAAKVYSPQRGSLDRAPWTYELWACANTCFFPGRICAAGLVLLQIYVNSFDSVFEMSQYKNPRYLRAPVSCAAQAARISAARLDGHGQETPSLFHRMKRTLRMAKH